MNCISQKDVIKKIIIGLTLGVMFYSINVSYVEAEPSYIDNPSIGPPYQANQIFISMSECNLAINKICKPEDQCFCLDSNKGGGTIGAPLRIFSYSSTAASNPNLQPTNRPPRE